MKPGHRAGLLIGTLFLLAVLVPFWLFRILASGSGYALDAVEYHYPNYLWLYSHLADGSLPLWNPFQLCGIPTLATLQAGLLYPLHIVYLVLPTHLGMAASGLLHLALIAGSTLIFCRRLGLGLPAALLAAVLVAMRGAQPGHILNPSMQEAGAWLGVGFLGVLDLARGSRPRGIALLAIATGLSLLAGFPQFSVYSVYSWGFVLCLLLIQERAGRARAWTALVGCLAAVALGSLIAAVEILPGLELSSVGGRERGVLPVGMMFPLGVVGLESPWKALQSALSSRPALPGVAFTFGAVGLVLLPAALFNRRQRTVAVAFGALGLLSLAFALGPATPLFDLYLLLPEIGSFRNPWRVLFVADFCFAVAAAIGLDALQRSSTAVGGDGDGPTNRGLAMPVACGLSIITAVLVARQGGASSILFASLAVGLVLVIAARRSAIGGAASLGLLALAVLEILVAPPNRRELPYDAESELLRPYHLQRRILSYLATQPDRVWTWFLGDMGSVSEKLPSIFAVRSISDNEIMTLRRQRQYFSYLMWGELEPRAVNVRGHSQRIFYGHYSILAPGIDVSGVVERSRLVDLAAARYLLVPRSAVGTPDVMRYLRERRLRLVDSSDSQIMLFEQPSALPRTYLTHRLREAPPPAQLLAALGRSDFDPRAESYVEVAHGELPQLEPGGTGEWTRIVMDGLHRVEVEARLTAPGLLVLADSFYPGWTAEVDGEPAPIFATNHLFRGVPLPAGEHRVVFHYAPSTVLIGGVGSIVGLLTLTGLGLWQRRRP